MMNTAGALMFRLIFYRFKKITENRRGQKTEGDRPVKYLHECLSPLFHFLSERRGQVSYFLLVHIDLEEVFYWTSKSEAEVDFIVPIGNEIFPLEVKGGFSRRIKSLRVYADKYHPAVIFRTSPRNFTRDGDFTNIPLYAVSLLPTLPLAVI